MLEAEGQLQRISSHLLVGKLFLILHACQPAISVYFYTTS